ncbi:ribosome small subunit-dependent GTPase A [Mycoavidus sp. B2-EB]|uniref:ribosome small subunit-dependent GTPase A n=1 Tax=Mycoavidus sp. B2-EB TaxID=2651972 RepID=UPI00162412ED|nr:ribosome small subunit-dependent GTPase A [Mycoavidus sp. B2-EB]BBO59547.1 putative ribosome biogenesis GTPase RsgA [Mycoavidus sp. B2-EB]
MNALEHGVITAAYGRHYLIELENHGGLLQGFPRGKKNEAAVGDKVICERRSNNQGVIVEILPRRNLLYRSDLFKTKYLAANLDQLLIVLATEPYFSEDLLGRALVAAQANQLTVLIVLNKTDLTAQLANTRARLNVYRGLGFEVLETSVCAHPQATHKQLVDRLAGRATLLLGQSGMGKSSLVNLLVPEAQAATREISTALKTGKHTTTLTRLYTLPEGGVLIDSPGFQEFGLHHLPEETLVRAFVEFQPFLAGCRFYNCRHLHEPNCAVLAALERGEIAPARHALYMQLLTEKKR